SKEEGRLDIEYLKKIVSETKSGKILLNLIHVSNLSGIINPVKEIRRILGDRGFIYLDIAQSAGHMPINLDELDVDFAGVSSHKMYGPMGIGLAFINKKSERYIGTNVSGGNAVNLISRWFTSDSGSPEKYEPGTQDFEGAIEWGFTIDYLNKIGMKNIENHDKELASYFIKELQKIDRVTIYGPTNLKDRTAVVSFNIDHFLKKNYDQVARELDNQGISVRDGCFCTHIYASQMLGLPRAVNEGRTVLMKMGASKNVVKLPGAVRASFAFYNNLEDAYKAVCAIRDIAAK
ncbi:aminotransferase class V-fold PLP-dependent enzyme, partial [[Eubacterium] cellulosolvens]